MTKAEFALADERFNYAVNFIDSRENRTDRRLATRRQASKYRRKTGLVYRASRSQAGRVYAATGGGRYE